MQITREAFYRIIEDTWTSTLGFQVEPDEPGDSFVDPAFSVCVKIAGAWEGEVALHCPPQLARLIAAAIFQVHADKVGSYEILDALSELIHIVGGNVKALLPRPVDLALPTLPDSSHGSIIAPTGEMVLRLALRTEGHPFVVSLLRCTPKPPAADPQPDKTNGCL